jgi:hypothetical protein
MPLVIAGNSSGSTTVQATDAVTATITLPSATTTLVGATTPSFTTTIGVGAATPSASGAGITFPATQSASTNANTLDDYEEGTWTPVITGSTSGTVSGGTARGTYTKTGNLVHASFTFTNPTTGLAIVGDWKISLPFAVSLQNSAYFGGCITYNRSLNAVTGDWLSLWGETNGISYVKVVRNNINGTESSAVTGTVSASLLLSGELTYFTA